MLAVDTRGQSGESTDPTVYSSGHVKGWMTAGVLDPQEYYYRGAYVDCVRALDVLATRPEVDMSHVGVTGGSQGGGLTLAVSALDSGPRPPWPTSPTSATTSAPWTWPCACPIWRSRTIIKIYPAARAPGLPHPELLRQHEPGPAHRSVRCSCRCGLVDDITARPPAIFATYNHLICHKELKIYRYHNHEDILPHWAKKLAWAQKYLLGE